MSVGQPVGADELSSPDRRSILVIMQDCGCDETEAIKLLKHSNNDCEEAKIRHRTLMRYMNHRLPARRRPFVPNKPPFLSAKPYVEPEIGASTDYSSEDEYLFNTPQTEEDLSPRPPRSIPTGSDLEPFPIGQTAEADSEAHPIPIRSPITAFALPPPSDSTRASETQREATEEPIIKPEISHLQGDILLSEPADVDPSKNAPEIAEWDFILPMILGLSIPLTDPGESQGDFNLRGLIGTMQAGASEQVIQNYLAYHNKELIKSHINKAVEGFPAMFFAVATNNEQILRAWIAYGGDVNAVYEASKVPLLAFAIMHSETIQEDTTEVVATLLSLGALPQVIPASFYTPYCQDLPDKGPDDESLNAIDDRAKTWCTADAKAKLSRTINLTHRYNLDRASRIKKISSRQRQVAYRKNAEALLGLPYFLIGQEMAAKRLLKKLLAHLVVRDDRPLVLAFAGPSGHGKTEMARRLGHLLSLELEVVDCTIVTREIELFGPRNPYVGSDRGSPLNNFLCRNSGQRSIVFLDEFEKTTPDIHQALLLPFDSGEYQDRRTLAKIDCRKTVWILATNALDHTIQSFCKLHEKAIFHTENNESEKMRLMKHLSKDLRQDFLSRFGSPITGRVSEIIPFLPFSPSEASVVVHKYLLELGVKVREKINLTPGPEERLLGNVRVKVRHDGAVCTSLATAEYHKDLGARSLINAVKSVEEMLVEAYLDVDEEIREEDELVEFVVDVKAGEVAGRIVLPELEKKKKKKKKKKGEGKGDDDDGAGASGEEVESEVDG